MVSIITVVNNYEIFERGLQGSLKEQERIDYELIIKDNHSGHYTSLAEAYNEASTEAKGEWLIFCHPDICFLSNDELNRIINACEKISCEKRDIGIFGAAGAMAGRKHWIVSSIVHGQDKRGGFVNDFGEAGYRNVQTVDACCFIVKASIAEAYPFWVELKGFHMCVEELCLRLQENRFITVVIPMKLWHFSDGRSLDSTYYRETIRVLARHPGIRYLNTTSFHWRVNCFLRFRLGLYQARNIIRRRLSGILAKCKRN